YPWRHPDPGVDDLQREVMALAGTAATRPRSAIFADVAALAGVPAPPPRQARAAVPYLDEPWYC
ncbi:MAG: CUAEP/CCAEP-tail radical SAM protein, partial [Vicinamibacterales bacterium]